MKNALAIIAGHGRYGDDTLVHMSKKEVRDLDRAVPGGLPRNPNTGLPEAFKLKDVISIAAPIASAVAAPYIGDAVGGLFGVTDPDNLRLIGAIGGGLGSALLTGASGGDPVSGGLTGFGAGMLGPTVRGYLDPNWAASRVPAVMENGVQIAGPAQPRDSSWIGRHGNMLGLGALGLGALGLMSGGSSGSSSSSRPAQPQGASVDNRPLPNYTMNRGQLDPTQNANTSWYRLGRIPSARMFFDNVNPSFMAQGGSVKGRPPSGLSTMSRPIDGPGGGQDDLVPIMGSRGEYVIDATTVADLGDGSTDRGVEKLDQFREIVAKEKGRKKVVPGPSRSALGYFKQIKG